MSGTNTTILVIPGLGDSGENHWQTLWLKEISNTVKVSQDNWDEPSLNHWITRLNETIDELDDKIVLVAHSLAVSLVAHWAERFKNPNVVGALLVAPADVDSPEHTPGVVRSFAPMPLLKFPFPTIVVASDNDSFVSVERAKFFAGNWGSSFVNIGAKGHINSDSNLGNWQEGQQYLAKLLQAIRHP
ncbi:RBBP9/YdeN family alpha/beta hydrolase [Foetidibacter luteolus]|uniref:RBBP9/YdeN family alpha/beta hydrolase n=1 Tax=Foetidibacter luteolus TaxID=2608880 RepID=UPI00129A8DC5|nr:alpha/beta hydrolase [Foetidibacter luteolus]